MVFRKRGKHSSRTRRRVPGLWQKNRLLDALIRTVSVGGMREEADGWGFLFSEESHVKCDLDGQFFVVMMDPSWREKDLDEPPHE